MALESFVPTSYEDRGSVIKFTDAGSESAIVDKRDVATLTRVFNNFADLPILPAEIQSILDGIGSPNPVASPEIKESEVSITSPEILTLHETPVKIIENPGEGNIIDVLSVIVICTYATAYTDASGATLYLKYVGGSDAIIAFAASDLLTASVNKVQAAKPVTPISDLSLAANKGVVIALDNAVTVGTSTLKVKVSYRIVSTS